MNARTTNPTDETRVESGVPVNENEMKDDVPEVKKKPRGSSAKNVVSGGLGMMAGVVGAMGIMAFREAPQVEAPENTGGGSGGIEPIPEPDTLEEIEIATSPEDSMCFNDAFAAAREEVGPNGVFEWRGGVYGTYYAEEWNAFSDEYKEEFGNHNWLAEFSNTEDSDSENGLADAHAVLEPGFGEHVINIDENGNQYITLQDAITGEEVRISPEDLQYAVLDEQGELVGVVGEDMLANLENAGEGGGYLVLDDEGHFADYVDDAVEPIGDGDDVDILNGPGTEDDFVDVVDDDPAVIDGDDDDAIGDYLADNDMPDYTNDAPIDDFIA